VRESSGVTTALGRQDVERHARSTTSPTSMLLIVIALPPADSS